MVGEIACPRQNEEHLDDPMDSTEQTNKIIEAVSDCLSKVTVFDRFTVESIIQRDCYEILNLPMDVLFETSRRTALSDLDDNAPAKFKNWSKERFKFAGITHYGYHAAFEVTPTRMLEYASHYAKYLGFTKNHKQELILRCIFYVTQAYFQPSLALLLGVIGGDDETAGADRIHEYAVRYTSAWNDVVDLCPAIKHPNLIKFGSYLDPAMFPVTLKVPHPEASMYTTSLHPTSIVFYGDSETMAKWCYDRFKLMGADGSHYASLDNLNSCVAKSVGYMYAIHSGAEDMQKEIEGVFEQLALVVKKYNVSELWRCSAKTRRQYSHELYLSMIDECEKIIKDVPDLIPHENVIKLGAFVMPRHVRQFIDQQQQSSAVQQFGEKTNFNSIISAQKYSMGYYCKQHFEASGNISLGKLYFSIQNLSCLELHSYGKLYARHFHLNCEQEKAVCNAFMSLDNPLKGTRRCMFWRLPIESAQKMQRVAFDNLSSACNHVIESCKEICHKNVLLNCAAVHPNYFRCLCR